jgi:hypothetical protein
MRGPRGPTGPAGTSAESPTLFFGVNDTLVDGATGGAVPGGALVPLTTEEDTLQFIAAPAGTTIQHIVSTIVRSNEDNVSYRIQLVVNDVMVQRSDVLTNNSYMSVNYVVNQHDRISLVIETVTPNVSVLMSLAVVTS